ncbi:MAG: hypothetical protein ACM37W_17425 [Actinomycetota bacterium]
MYSIIDVPAVVEVVEVRRISLPWYSQVAETIRFISRHFASAGTFHLLNDLSVLVGLI